MEISRIIEDKISYISLSGNLLGEKDSNPIIESISKSIENDSNLFVVDVKELQYVNSTGISALISILTKSRNAGGEMILINLPSQLKKILELTKLDKVFPLAEDKETAVKLLNR
ncbi:MAG: STAS domain-containing protein [Chitinophagales bacterium]|nr:STAS domain-containing protein [Chitinophagales bacterium]